MGADGAYVWSRASCNTPLVVAFDDAPVRFIRPHGDASFAIGVENRTEWVSSDTPWLALDRNRNGCIDDQSELFAGFEALAALDDNHDERIDSSDEAFERLRLWIDSSHPRQCTSDELRPLSSYGIVALDLRWTDQRPVTQGSYEGERAPLQRTNGSRRGRVVDVHVAPTDD